MIVNRSAETRNPQERERQQSQQIQTIIKRVYEKTAFYRERMNALGVTPADFTTIQDIRKLPFLSACDLAANHPFGLLTIPVSGIARFIAADSGRTAVGLTQQDLTNQVEMIARGLVSCNITMSSVLMILPEELDLTTICALQQAAEAIGATVLNGPANDVKGQIRLMFDYGVTTVFSGPNTLFTLADFVKTLGFGAHELPLLNLLCPERSCAAPVRTALQQQFQIPLHLAYGHPDLLPLGIACSCHAQADLHLQDDHFYPELIDPQSGQPASARQAGELVLTTLSREAMPLIRYRTGTRAMLSYGPCSCGRTTPRLRLLADDLFLV